VHSEKVADLSPLSPCTHGGKGPGVRGEEKLKIAKCKLQNANWKTGECPSLFNLHFAFCNLHFAIFAPPDPLTPLPHEYMGRGNQTRLLSVYIRESELAKKLDVPGS
jgi:hypothetical protein